ncbi:hypothetical protein ACWCXH_14395 [Kitasatospora sp. NPDC001660]
MATCTPMTVHVGAKECLDGECADYFDEDGQWLGIDACPHLGSEQLCETHSTTDANRVVNSALWPCPSASTSKEPQ